MPKWVYRGKVDFWERVPTAEEQAKKEALSVKLVFGAAAVLIVLVTGVAVWLG